MDFIIQLYIWGLLAAVLVHLVTIIWYSFSRPERRIYEANLKQIDLSWDPLYDQIYWSSDFKHTASRFWIISFVRLLRSLLSWYEVFRKLYRIKKNRDFNKFILTPKQKEAAWDLSHNPLLSKEQVMQKMKIVYPDLPIYQETNIQNREEVADEDEVEEENLDD